MFFFTFFCTETILLHLTSMFISDITKKNSHRAGIKAMIAFISHFLGDNPFTPDAAQSCKMISVEF